MATNVKVYFCDPQAESLVYAARTKTQTGSYRQLPEEHRPNRLFPVADI